MKKLAKTFRTMSILTILLLTLTACMNQENQNTQSGAITNSEENKVNEVKKEVASDGDTVLVHYTGTFENGEKFDSSYDRGSPLEFVVGGGQMIPGFDAGVKGMKLGEKKTLTLEPKDAYGERDESRKDVVPRSELKDFEEMGIVLEKGAQLPTMMGTFEIIDADEENVTVDMNHQMAGKTLIFEVELVEVK